MLDKGDQARIMYVMDGQAVKSAVRTLELLEYFATTESHASVMDISTALGYPQSSTSMLLFTLESEGYLHFDKVKRTYSPTVRTMLLGAKCDRGGLGAELVAQMRKLHTATECTVVVGMQQGVSVRQIFSINAKHLHPVIIPNGTLRPICRTAMGKILLSSLPDEEVARIARKANSLAPRQEDKVSVKELNVELLSVRAAGYARTLDYPAPDRSALAVALPAYVDQPPLAMSIGARKSVMTSNLRSFLVEMQRTCAALAAAMKLVVPEERDVAGHSF